MRALLDHQPMIFHKHRQESIMHANTRPTTIVKIVADCDPSGDVREYAAAIVFELAQLADLESHAFHHFEQIKLEIHFHLIFRGDVRDAIASEPVIRAHFLEYYDGIKIRAVHAFAAATFDATI
jgi:hypothetical protein